MLVTKNPKCDFCGTSLSEVVYHPKHSRRGMEVLVCGSCGLVQSLQGNIEPNRIQTLSTDADWGNVRHGKSVRFDFLKSILIDEIKWGEVKKALDSSKVEDALNRFERYETKIDGLESQIESYDLGKQTLADEIADLQKNEKIDDELAELKKKLANK